MRKPFVIVAAVLALVGAASASAVEFTQGVVAADHVIASEAGAAMLARGGNAVDAAIATSFCLSVVRPMSCGIGGGGFMVIYQPDAAPDKRRVTLNYRETAPAAVSPEFFATLDVSDASRFTGAAVATPGTVAGLWKAHQMYGSLPWRDLLQPAIAAAEHGFEVNQDYMVAAEEAIAWYAESPARRESHPFVWERFLRRGHVQAGDVIRNPEQAKALRLIAERGPDGFYRGDVAQAMIAATRARHGVLTEADMESYTVDVGTPLEWEWAGRTVMVMPPPSSGGVATIEALGALAHFERIQESPLSELDHNSATYLHLLAEVFKHCFVDRSQWLGDPNFEQLPLDQLLNDDYLRSIAERIDLDQVQPRDRYGLAPTKTVAPDDAGTSHLSVIDASGMAVACTETINLTFGSRIAVEEFGFCLNNEMDDFTTAPGAVNAFGLKQSDLNLPEEGKRPLSSMSPTIVVDASGAVELITGARGGPRIITAVIQSILNALVFDMPASAALAAPRVHHQWFPPVLAMEPAFLPSVPDDADPTPESMMRMFSGVSAAHELQAALKSKGHLVGAIATVGSVQLIKHGESGYEAASDPRGGGKPVGVNAEGELVVVQAGE